MLAKADVVGRVGIQREFDGAEAPDIVIEVAGPDGVRTVPVTARELQGQDDDAAFERFVSRSSAFASYQRRAARRLPVIRLAPRQAPA